MSNYYFQMKVKEYIIENKAKIALGALGLAAAAGLIYWLTRKPTPTQKPTPAPPANQLSQSKVSATSTAVNNEEQPEPEQDQATKKLNRVTAQVRSILLKNSDRITPELITAVIRGQYELANEEVRAAILRSRRERREKLDDHLEYARIVTGHQLELEEIQEKYLSLILARFNIDKVSWKDASEEWEQATGEGEQGISDLIRNEEEKQLLSLRSKSSPPKTLPQISQILAHKITLLESLNPQQLGFTLAIDEAARYEMIQTYINDLVHKEFAAQPEDLEYSIEHLSKEEKGKVIQFQDRIGELMDGLIVVDQEDGDGHGEGEGSFH